jgi:sugar transferase (PEP-CTERM/EpsH1 system associated)
MTDSNRLRILIVTPSLPYPLIWGFGIRVYQIIKFLAQRHDVTVLAYATPTDHGSIAALRQTGATVHAVVREEPSTTSKRRAQLTSLFSTASFQWQSLESAAMQATIDRVLKDQDFDVIQIESSQMTGFEYDSSALLLVDEHNIEYELLYRAFRTEPSPLRKLYNWVEYRKFRHEEQASWKHSGGCILTSDRELTILQRYAPHTPSLVVPNGVDVDYFQPLPGPTNPDNVVFVGVMHYRPNVDAALYFAREILPLILKVRPELKFTIVGGGAPDEVRRLASKNVVIAGQVPDTRPYIASAGACVVPLRMGSGTRLKVLEGLAMGKAMVSTSIGCEGIATQNGRDLLVADEPAAFAQSVLRLVEDSEFAGNLGRGGRKLVEEQYSWASVLQDLERFMGTNRPRHTVRDQLRTPRLAV